MLKCPPGATAPEFQPSASEVDVWSTESTFVHVTVVPAATSRLSGAKALFPSKAAPTGIATEDDGPPGTGAGDGAGEVGDEGDDE